VGLVARVTRTGTGAVHYRVATTLALAGVILLHFEDVDPSATVVGHEDETDFRDHLIESTEFFGSEAQILNRGFQTMVDVLKRKHDHKNLMQDEPDRDATTPFNQLTLVSVKEIQYELARLQSFSVPEGFDHLYTSSSGETRACPGTRGARQFGT